MPTDEEFLSARGALAAASRWGTPDETDAARKNFDSIKAARLREEAANLESGRASHDHLLNAQIRESAEFMRDHPNPRDWTQDIDQQWSDLLARHTQSHIQRGCPETANCRRGRG